MERNAHNLTWLATLVASAAFLVVLAVFAHEIADYRNNVEMWARRDLRMRAKLAADNLAEALATQDFRRIGEVARGLSEDDVLLTVYSGPGGVFYRSSERTTPDIRESATVDGYRIELGFPKSAVFRPFNRAVRGFLLAALAGVMGMMVVFFALYRQRVRIRELARLERFRREFIADVSHEIKTPLTGILGAVGLLTDGATLPEKETQTLLGLVGKESARLNGLVQQILDLARLEREGEVLNALPVDLAALVRECVDTLRPRAEAANVRLTAQLAPLPPVACDGRLIAEALANLIENALRHSRSPEVAVVLEDGAKSLEGRLRNRRREVVRIVVEDHGIGIPREEAVRIFERFHRVDPARAAESGGAGLGLAIVRRIARLHGGDVVWEPAVPRGSRFVLTICVG